MEDVDEGFGSNESNHSNHHKETILDDLKCLNGQNVLENTNGKKLFNGNVFENGSKKVDESIDMNDDSEKDLDLREGKNISPTSQCIGFANALRGQHVEENNKDEKTNSEDLSDSCLDRDTLSPAEKDNTSCSLKDNGVDIESDKSWPHDKLKESEKTAKCKDSEEECFDKTPSENHSNDLIVASPEHNKINESDCGDLNGGHTTDLTETELDKGCLDKIQTVDVNPMTPVKQQTSSAEGARSPFLLDDKVRNSLKGLVAKVKSSELSRESMSPSGSSVSGDVDSPASPGKLKEVSSLDDISLIDDGTENENNEETDTVNDFTEDTEEDILGDEEDGISMEIGSENEDDLLELSAEHSTEKRCNNKETEIAISDEPIEKSENQKSNMTLTATEMEDTNSSSAVEIDITSDIEDDTVQDKSEKEYKFKQDSVDKIQFEEDSNSNGNSGKINDIVNFLNRDLSGTNSPLTTSDNAVNDDCNSKIINNVLMETDNAESKDDNDIIMDEDSDNGKLWDDANCKLQTEKDTVTKGKIKDNLDEKCKDISSVNKEEDGPSLGETEGVEQKLKVSDDDNESNKEDLETKAQTEECNTGETTELVCEKEVEEDAVCEKEVEEDDDDDVIFEGATMPSMRNEYQRIPSRVGQSVSVLKYSKEKSDNTNNVNSDNKDETVSKEEDDDDVIFEKETKAEDNKSKQNCDTLKTSNGDTDESESIQNIESSPSLNNTNNSNAEEVDNSIGKVSVITSRNSSDRKRSAEDKELEENESKRSRLDLTGLIGKLESRVEPASIELSDESEEEGDKPMDAEPVTEKDKEENVKKEENEKVITVTEKELEELVREKVKAYLTSQRDTLVAKLSQKVKELQQNNDLWKRQVKDLQVKVNDVTVLQQKLEKRKAATAALRQITTRNVAVQVDEGREDMLLTMSANAVLKQMLARKMSLESTTPSSSSEANIFISSTASSKTPKVSSTPPRVATQLPLVTAPGGNGTIRLPIPQSSIAPAVLSTHMSQGSKMVTTTYQTPSVKSLLDTTRLQKTVGSMPTTTTSTVNTSVFGLLQYPTNFVPKPAQGYVQQTVTPVTTQTSSNVSKTVSVAKTVTLPSPNAAKVIDLTDDDDSTKTRLVTLPTGINTVTNQQGVRHVLAPPGAQLVRTGMPNQQTYQLVFSSPPAIRPGMMMTVASALPQTTSILQTVQQSQTLVNLSSPTAVAPGTTLARAAVPTTTITPKPPVNAHPAPFPALPPKQQTAGLKGLPPKPSLKISRVSQGIVLSWNMSLNDTYSEISNYQLFAYQETSAQPVSTLWKKVGDVKALPLPMACTLTQFQVGNKYHFAVRAMDTHNRVGAFSDPGSIHLTPSTPTK